MSPAVSGRPQRRRFTPARTRRLSMVAAGLLAIGALGVAGPSIASAMGLSIDRAATSDSGGFDQAVRLNPPAPRPTTPSVSRDVQAVLDLTNAERSSRGLGPLQIHPQLMEAAQEHFIDQFRQGCSNLSHTGTDGSSPFDRIKRTGLRYRAAGENIACGYSTPSAVMNGWMNSSGHRANILNGTFTHIGIVAEPDAFGRMYWVQVFATPR